MPENINNEPFERQMIEEEEVTFHCRLAKQQINKDYNEEKEKCECGIYLNSHDQCPRCDY